MDDTGLVTLCEVERWKHKLGAVEGSQGRQHHRVGRIRRSKKNHLLREPAFAWWAPVALCRQRRIIKTVAARHSRYHKRYEKFGLELPKMV